MSCETYAGESRFMQMKLTIHVGEDIKMAEIREIKNIFKNTLF